MDNVKLRINNIDFSDNVLNSKYTRQLSQVFFGYEKQKVDFTLIFNDVVDIKKGDLVSFRFWDIG